METIKKQIILDAVKLYTNLRWKFAIEIAQKSYCKQDGSMPSIKEVCKALAIAKACDEALSEVQEM